ncbi:MAG: acetyl-CoA carboxylase biotin carboxylase subunit [Chloroflexi bacterium]|nr:acetyl-CoA carboxylase biotin carboxylase subunit [Chloroflexota bacterium]
MKLQKCLIANRGEIAVRILRACFELGMQAVAVYSDADRQARHVQMADEAYLLGGAAPAESYLNIEKLIAVARKAGCDCVHPGYGFLSEAEEFAQAVLDAGLVWVGPPPDAIRKMGVKTEARALMQAAGVPLVPGFQADDATEDDFLAAADKIGYPLMVKAAGGGGGKGIRIVRRAQDLPDALAGARREALHAFGDARLFLERYIEHGRHIEIQVLADAHGSTVHLFERECSAQRRHQKVIEESPSPLLTPEIRAQMGQAAVSAAQAVAYTNAGTVEFIASAQGEFYFLEMNTRLQVEHPVTELVTGLDLVKLQFAVAAGEKLPFTQSDLSQRGHAIECRIYAEDPLNQFLPAIGPLLLFQPPEGPGIRVDSGVQSGDSIGLHYDPMIAKIIVYERTRAAAIERMSKALRDTVILGTTTNTAFLRALLEHPAFTAGVVHTAFIEENLDDLLQGLREPLTNQADMALLAAALHDSQAVGAAQTGHTSEDAPEPWAHADSFRMGRL